MFHYYNGLEDKRAFVGVNDLVINEIMPNDGFNYLTVPSL